MIKTLTHPNFIPVKKLTKQDMVTYYQYTMIEAAGKLGCCSTLLKKRCRELEIIRWPHRAYVSLMQLQAQLVNAELGLEKKRQLASKIENGLETYKTNPNVKLKDIISKYDINLIRNAGNSPSVVNHSPLNRQETKAVSALVSLSSQALRPQSFAGSPYSLFSFNAKENNTTRLYLMDNEPSRIEWQDYKNSYIYCNENLYRVSESGELSLLMLFNMDYFKDEVAKLQVRSEGDYRMLFLTPDVERATITWNTIPSEMVDETAQVKVIVNTL